MVDERLKDLLNELLPLVDKGYGGRSELEQMGLSCFKVQDEVIKYFCGDKTTYQEELRFRVNENKHIISHGRYMADYFLNNYKRAHEESIIFQEEWRAVLSPFWKNFMRNEQQFPSSFEKTMAKFSARHDDAWREELSIFSLKDYDYAQYSDLDFVDAVINDLYSELGFVLNKYIASKTQRVYVKIINEYCSVYHQFDLNELYKKRSRSGDTKIINCWFGVLEKQKKRMMITNPKFNKSLLNHSLFFPINIIGVNQYLQQFSTQEELGAIININFYLYELLVKYGFEDYLESRNLSLFL